MRHSLLFTTSCVALISVYLKMSAPSIPLPAGTQWVDQGPLPLVVTEVHRSNGEKKDMFSVGASHMTLLHNVILRGFNSIYLQAPHVKDDDLGDFVQYSLAWCRFTKAHHDDEEAELFPRLAGVVKNPDLMKESLEEHRNSSSSNRNADLFEQGLEKMTNYLAALPPRPTTTFSSADLISLMDAFKDPFGQHFGQDGEVAHLASFATLYPDQPELRPIFATWGKNSLMKTGVLDGIPFMFCNLDRTAEDGRWADWPRIPGPIKWGMIHLGGAWNARLWRFGSCDQEGKPRELEALRGAK